MARNIKIGDIGDYAADQFDKLLKAAVFETDKRVKLASPVDTGRFRASWAIGQNAAPFPGEPEGSYPTAPPPNAVNYQLGTEKAGNVYSVHNNLVYADPLARGHSRQAPDGWVDGIAKDIQTWVDSEADRIGRQS
jgi:hypothetical protein